MRRMKSLQKLKYKSSVRETYSRGRFTLVRMSVIKKARTNLNSDGARGTLTYCWWGGNASQSLCKLVWRFFKNSEYILYLGK